MTMLRMWVIQICIADNGTFTFQRLACHMTDLIDTYSSVDRQFLPKVTTPFLSVSVVSKERD